VQFDDEIIGFFAVAQPFGVGRHVSTRDIYEMHFLDRLTGCVAARMNDWHHIPCNNSLNQCTAIVIAAEKPSCSLR